jgi:protein-S-isoprenylcysteine O-methyltransferase Ste14
MVLVFYLVYMVAAWACLWQWGRPYPAERIDLYSGGFFLLAPLWMAESLHFVNRVAGGDARDEAFGHTFDRAMSGWTSVLAGCDLAVFLDYGRWRLVPELIHPVPQSLGLALWALVPFWLLWADRHLRRHFAGPDWRDRLTTGGPFARVRHPRYAGLLASRLAFALLLGSVVAWGLLAGWALLVARRIRLEERHLRSRYGEAYEAYASRTPRLFPGLF